MTLAYVDYRGPLVSTNSAYKKTRTGIFYMSAEGKAFKAGISLEARRAMQGRTPTKAPVCVLIDFWFRSLASDVDGPVKLVLDALQGQTYVNDKQVVYVSAAKHKAGHPGQVGLSLTVNEVPNEDTP